MNKEILRPPEQLSNMPRFTPADYVQALDNYLEDANRENILKPRQDLIYKETRDFFHEADSTGELKARVISPTGTGKTVVFVELTKALLNARNQYGESPRILVVTPKKDLVHQTVGESGKRGYGRFAPELEIGTFYSDSRQGEREAIDQYNVVVTTYKSFNIMARTEYIRDRTPEEKKEYLERALKQEITKSGTSFTFLYDSLMRVQSSISRIPRVPSGIRLVDLYDVIFLDEAHHLLGEVAGDNVETISGKPVIGFTATQKINQKRQLKQHLPYLIHEFSLKESIEAEELAPLATVGVKSGTKIEGSDLFDTEGEYLEEKLTYLARSKSRNKTIVDIAKVLRDHGIGTIVPCLRGSEALHARLLAENMNRAGIATEAVHGSVSLKKRNEIYEKFEEGRIDAMTYVEVLGEGWDSNRAKAIINARPSRSLIIAEQRLGRILRLGGLAFAIDIIDEYDMMNPPLHAPDILGGEEVESGHIFGNVTDEEKEFSKNIISKIGQQVVLSEFIKADYSTFHSTLSMYPEIKNGNLISSDGGHYSLAERISIQYKQVTDEIIDKLWEMNGLEPERKMGRKEYTIRNTYNSATSKILLDRVPLNDVNQVFVKNEERWMSAEGFAIAFSKKYPKIDAELTELMLNELSELLEWQPLKQPLGASFSGTRKFSVYKGYNVGKTKDILDRQLKEYFEIVEAVSKK